jgi:hypothetical protein
MTLDLTDDETHALVQLLRRAIEYDPFTFAPRLDPLKAILAKLEPSTPQPEKLPPLKTRHKVGAAEGDRNDDEAVYLLVGRDQLGNSHLSP